MRRAIIALAVLAPLALAAGARADWDGNECKMQFPQLPNLDWSPVVDCSFTPAGGAWGDVFLADDFQCTQSGPITGIHTWMSRLNDMDVLDGSGWPRMFNLAIYANIPAGEGNVPYSRPGELLWQSYVCPVAERLWATDANERFIDPAANQVLWDSCQTWQYNFSIDPNQAFVQEEGQTYWLGIHRSIDLNGDGVIDVDTDYAMALASYFAGGLEGWRTSEDHWMDGAVWAWIDSNAVYHAYVDPEYVVGCDPWNRVLDPATGLPVDMAFVITPEPASLAVLAVGAAWALIRRRRK